jgi:hypothetical protein
MGANEIAEAGAEQGVVVCAAFQCGHLPLLYQVTMNAFSAQGRRSRVWTVHCNKEQRKHLKERMCSILGNKFPDLSLNGTLFRQ